MPVPLEKKEIPEEISVGPEPSTPVKVTHEFTTIGDLDAGFTYSGHITDVSINDDNVIGGNVKANIDWSGTTWKNFEQDYKANPREEIKSQIEFKAPPTHYFDVHKELSRSEGIQLVPADEEYASPNHEAIGRMLRMHGINFYQRAYRRAFGLRSTASVPVIKRIPTQDAEIILSVMSDMLNEEYPRTGITANPLSYRLAGKRVGTGTPARADVQTDSIESTRTYVREFFRGKSKEVYTVVAYKALGTLMSPELEELSDEQMLAIRGEILQSRYKIEKLQKTPYKDIWDDEQW